MTLRLKRGDNVQVIAGSFRGKRGKVLRVMRAEAKILVQGINMRYRHVKRNQKYPQGGRIQKECAIHASNVMLYDGGQSRPVRTRAERGKDGKKIRVSCKSGKQV
ncbi:MAG: 50S ribosomal protein L24 [Planctomycetes bacterium]|nr:50S ribosomal protein L24 [Planctomycetota bacterium]